METREETAARLLVTDDRELGMGGIGGGGRLWIRFWDIELIGIADELNVVCERKRRAKDDSKIYGLNSGKNGAASYHDVTKTWAFRHHTGLLSRSRPGTWEGRGISSTRLCQSLC